jgi:Caspase domain/WD domain, G-beta repeat
MARRLALIVANDAYGDERLAQLRSPAEDAKQLERVLREPDIGSFDEVTTLANNPSHVLERKLEQFFGGAALNDLLLVHFSCHGVLDDDDALYFACSNTDLDAPRSTAVEAAKLNRYMTDSRSKRIVLLLDCCYAGAFQTGVAARGTKDVAVNQRFEGDGRYVITASKSTQSAYEKDGGSLTTQIEPSFFTAGLVLGLETGEAARADSDWVSVDDLYHYLSEYLERENPAQKPGRKLNGGGSIAIAKSKRRSGAARYGHPDRRDYSLLEPLLELRAENELFAVAISPDLRTIVAGTENEVLCWSDELPVKAWSRDTPPPPRPLIPAAGGPLHENYVYSVAFSPDGTRVASADEDGRVRVTGLDGNEVLDVRAHTDAVYTVAFAPHGGLVASGGWDGQILIWDLRTRAVRKKTKRIARISSVAFSRDPKENLVAIGSHDDTVLLWAFERQNVPVALPGGHRSSVEAVAFGPPPSLLLASCGLDKTVRLWDVSQRIELWEVPGMHEYLVRAVAFSPDGGTIVSASWDKTMLLWDATAPTGVATEMPDRPGWKHDDWIWSVAFSDDGTLLASCGSDEKIIVWALPDAAPP